MFIIAIHASLYNVESLLGSDEEPFDLQMEQVRRETMLTISFRGTNNLTIELIPFLYLSKKNLLLWQLIIGSEEKLIATATAQNAHFKVGCILGYFLINSIF